MLPGKLSPRNLQEIVFPRRGARRSDVLVRAGIGLDSAVVDLGDQLAVLSTDPITGAGKRAGWLAINVGCNDLAAAGAEPVAALVTMLLSPESAHEDAEALMGDADLAAMQLGVEIVGGHTEITAGLSRSMIVVTALGRCPRERLIAPTGMRPGDAVLMTKWAGVEGTAILASDYGSLLQPVLGLEGLVRAQALLGDISVVPEAAIAARIGVSAMHDATEGGVIGALAELAQASGHGVLVEGDQIPVLAETRAICSYCQIDPLHLVSSGVLIIVTAHADAILKAVSAVGCTVTRIGTVKEGPGSIRFGGMASALVAPERDALWTALARLGG